MKTSLRVGIETSLRRYRKTSLRLWLPMFFWFAIGLTVAVVLKPNMDNLGSILLSSKPNSRIYQHGTYTPIRVLSRDTVTSHRGNYFSS